MAGISNYLRDQVIDFLKATPSAMPAPPTAHVGLWTGSPGGAGTEITVIAARQALAMTLGTGKASENTSAITWPASGGTATVDYWGIHSATTGGQLLWWGGFTSAKSVTPGDTVEINAGALDISSAGSATEAFMRAVMDWIDGTAFPYTPGTIYVGLFNGDPKGAGVEKTDLMTSNGKRVAVGLTGSGGVISNSSEVDFGNSASAQTITHAAIFNSDTVGAGDMYLAEVLQATINPAQNDIVKFAVTSLQFTLS